MMKKFYLLCILMLIGTSLFAASPQDVEKTNFKVKITEFGYPLIPHASQLKVFFPLSLDYGMNKTAEFEVNIWYRAISPYFNPNIFYEVGVFSSINVIKKGRSDLFIGLGTAFSQNNENISIPLILPIEYRYAPLGFMELNISMQNMIYGEGFLSELILATALMPLSSNLSIDIGGTASLAFSWTEEIFEYSYGLLFGLGFQF